MTDWSVVEDDEDQEEEWWRRWIKVKKLCGDDALLDTMDLQSSG